MKKATILFYLCSSVLLFLFQFIYQYFGHGVHSTSLTYAWLIPLMGGGLLTLLAHFTPSYTTRLVRNLVNSALAIFASWSILNGILEIAGSDSPYLTAYLYAEVACILFSCVAYLHHQLA